MADTQFRLLGSDALSRVFRELGEQGHYGGQRLPTRQGIYVCTPSGRFLTSTQPADADTVLAMMQRGLDAWHTHPESRAAPASDLERVPVGEDRDPVDGLVLELTVRLIGVGHEGRSLDGPTSVARSAYLASRLNFDHVWFSKSEARQWIPEGREIGASRWLPGPLVNRIAALHLIDMVSGPPPVRFLSRDLGPSWIRTEVVGFEENRVHLRITGKTRAQARGRMANPNANQLETDILGWATFDLAAQSFDAFEAVALARGSDFQWPDRQSREGLKRIGFAFDLDSSGHGRTPPHFFHRYEGEWDACLDVSENTISAMPVAAR